MDNKYGSFHKFENSCECCERGMEFFTGVGICPRCAFFIQEINKLRPTKRGFHEIINKDIINKIKYRDHGGDKAISDIIKIIRLIQKEQTLSDAYKKREIQGYKYNEEVSKLVDSYERG